jgi:hypothetical protein
MGTAPLSSKKAAVRHLGDADSQQDIVRTLMDRISFRTWRLGGLRSRSRQDYYKGYRFTEPGQLPQPYDELYRSHAADNEYTVFTGDTPIAWYHGRLGWIAPQLGGFADTHTRDDYEKVRNAVLTITGKGPQQ